MKKNLVSATLVIGLILFNVIIIGNLRRRSDVLNEMNWFGGENVKIDVVDQRVTLVEEGIKGNNYFDCRTGKYLTKEQAYQESDSQFVLMYSDGVIVHCNRVYSFMLDMPYGKKPDEFNTGDYQETLKVKPVVGMEFGVELGGPLSVCKIISVTDTNVTFICSSYEM